ncbi:MAG TPA: universal stress protein [Candidatus Binatia bacterium]|jgi:nucleotide-binding universal stress UspA family protein|nr:universal stress protein [Candidatus Binatia bacterium]
MLREIVVPLDGSTLAECVLPHALAIAQAFEGRLTLLHVLESTPTSGRLSPLDWQLRKMEARSYLAEVAGRLQSCGFRVTQEVLEGPAAASIADFAHKHQADLIVLSTHGRGGLSRWNVSSVVQKVSQLAYTSLLLVRAYQTTTSRHNSDAAEPGHNGTFSISRYGRILVPLDGSMRAEVALPVATGIAQCQEAGLLLAHVVARPPLFSRPSLPAEAETMARRLVELNVTVAADYLAQKREHLLVDAATRLLVGEDVGGTFCQLLAEEKIDLAVLSAHGALCDTSRPFGNVAGSFVFRSNVPVLLVQDLTPQQVQPGPATLAAKSARREVTAGRLRGRP